MNAIWISALIIRNALTLKEAIIVVVTKDLLLIMVRSPLVREQKIAT